MKEKGSKGESSCFKILFVSFKIDHESNCSNENGLHTLWKKEIWKSECSFYIRLNWYRHRTDSIVYSRLINVEKHFHSNAQEFNEDIRFTVREKIEKIFTHWTILQWQEKHPKINGRSIILS